MATLVDPIQTETEVGDSMKELSLKSEESKKGSVEAEISIQRSVVENRTTTIKRVTKTPTLQVAKSFDQQVKKLIAEAAPNNTKAVLGKQLLQDQAMRLSHTLAQASDVHELIPLNKNAKSVVQKLKISSEDVTQKSEPLPIVKLHYTASGRKLLDTSIQTVISVDKLGASPNAGSMTVRYSPPQRSVVSSRSRASSALISRPSNTKRNSSDKPTPSKRITIDATPILENTSAARHKSKLLDDSAPSILPKQPLLPNVSSARFSSNTLSSTKSKRKSSAALLTVSKAISEHSRQNLNPLVGGSMQMITASRIRKSESKPIARRSLPTAVSSRKSGVAEGSSNVLALSKRSSQRVPSSKAGSFGEQFSAMLKKRSTKESTWKIDPLQSDLIKRLKKQSLKKPYPVTPGETIQVVSGQFKTPSGYSVKHSGHKSSMKPVLQYPSHRRSSQTGMITSKEFSSQRGESKVPQPNEALLNRMLMYCDCPDSEVSVEDEMPDLKFEFSSFRRSADSKKVSGTLRPKIRSVDRSPFERKDRAARAAFAKELEQMEIYEIEKKQRLKPRKIKKELKKEGVYETIKHICHIPDSYADTVRGSPSQQSITTGSSPKESPPSTIVEEKCASPSSSILEDKIQLRKDHSMGSKITTPTPLTREGAFHEIELSDESDAAPRSSSSSSQCEIISSSSEISLRVNLEKALSPAQLRKKRLKNAPFTNYQNKINAELILAEGLKNNTKILDANLEGVIIDKIATEFGEWAKENGVKPEAVEKDVIKELFQFGTMDTAANSIAVEIKELIVVPESITEGMYPELEERAAMYRQILFDEGAYWRTERYMAFGKPDPKPYKRPPNPPLPTWTKSGFVPQPLATGELLYQTLIDNDSMSVRYCMMKARYCFVCEGK